MRSETPEAGVLRNGCAAEELDIPIRQVARKITGPIDSSPWPKWVGKKSLRRQFRAIQVTPDDTISANEILLEWGEG